MEIGTEKETIVIEPLEEPVPREHPAAPEEPAETPEEAPVEQPVEEPVPGVIVPDSIEPYYGYKALQMTDGYLHSPSKTAIWPVKEKLVSRCQRTGGPKQPSFEWKLVPAPEGLPASRFWVSSNFLAEGTTTFFAWPSQEPPEGQTWIPEPVEHELGPCECGIYVVDHAKDTSSYMQGHDRVIVEIALWGQVVIAGKGARGQYAYPQKIYAAAQQAEKAAEVANNYDIPVEIVRFLP